MFSDKCQIVYRHYASIISNQALFFVFIVDACESELGILDLIQVFVEALDQSFQSVCELDFIFRQDQVSRVLDEIISGGIVLETDVSLILQRTQVAQ